MGKVVSQEAFVTCGCRAVTTLLALRPCLFGSESARSRDRSVRGKRSIVGS